MHLATFKVSLIALETKKCPHYFMWKEKRQGKQVALTAWVSYHTVKWLKWALTPVWKIVCNVHVDSRATRCCFPNICCITSLDTAGKPTCAKLSEVSAHFLCTHLQFWWPGSGMWLGLGCTEAFCAETGRCLCKPPCTPKSYLIQLLTRTEHQERALSYCIPSHAVRLGYS